MHEYSIVQSLVDSVERAIGGRMASVHGIEVRIGEISGVDPELLSTAYEVFRAGTICERAAMVIERIPARWECPRCGGAIGAGRALRCGECDEPARLAAGDEIVLQRIELEVA
jgi:hydrogenase nickel incorporation protein HypA/HybF